MDAAARPAPVEAAAARRDVPAGRAVRLAGAVVAAVAAGLALLVSFPPYGLWWLAPVGVALLTLAATGRRVVGGLGVGAVTGVAFFPPLLHWTNMQVGWMPWLLLSGFEALYLALLGAALAYTGRLTRRVPGLVAPVTGVLWVAQEALRDRVPFGGFPWARLAFAQADSPLLRLAALGGAPAVTFMVALIGGLLAAAVLSGVRAAGTPGRRRLLRAVGGPVVAAVALVALAAAVPTARPSGTGVTVAFVQGNVPRLGLDFNAQREQVLRNHVEGTEALARKVAAGELRRPDLVVWPENASDVDPVANPDAGELITQAARSVGVPILVGALLEGPGDHVRNVGLVWTPQGGPVDTYVKRHPVPFAEYVPMRSLARKVTTKVDLVREDFLPGDRPGVLRVGPATVGDVICFEIAYDDIVRDTVTGGGELIVTQTNNATFDADEAAQQLAMVRLRAVEHGRDAMMVSTVGISGFVGADGRVQGATSFNAPAVEAREVTLSRNRTLATGLGAVPEYVLLVGAGIAIAGAALIRRRPRPAEADTTVHNKGEV
ncbi:apolipoprotein N-acyltransferase [Planosporangium thailandense]|uniref:Apolipoprotein N-acyltransferase n=1 Tax=Planosporangium thailandense TaxID=765197 RepID=A0ABX0Y1B5_9ACTN|nr:apolipoprotein N-acyltransferase [Planosporangium thailandense]NJC72141.1 apolipoprotein N-acyltransferase [Planosporangium thailandense]